jgi:hypothetical protein
LTISQLSHLYQSKKEEDKVLSILHDLRKIDPSLVAKVNVLIEKSGAKVVISSAWRVMSIESLKGVLIHHGFKGEVIGVTPSSLSFECRGDEIQAWLDEHPEISPFVILDDVDDMGQLRSHLVKTDRLVGVSDKNIMNALKILDQTE